MIRFSQQQVEAELQIIEAALGRIRAGVGLSANAPAVAGNTIENNKPAKRSKKMLKHEAAIEIGRLLGRPDFINYIKF